MDLTTPAVLFPAISLLLLAYTNRFLGLASLISTLHDRYHAQPHQSLVAQIGNLRYRVRLIQQMQALGVLSLLVCVVCMLLLFVGLETPAKWMFASSLVLMVASLALSVREIQVSVNALNLQLQDLEDSKSQGKPS
jgi:hypothetical protein